MNIVVQAKPKYQTFGQERFYPACPMANAIAVIKESSVLRKNDLEILIQHGIGVKYFGVQSEVLDAIGAVRIIEEDFVKNLEKFNQKRNQQQ